MQTAFSPEKIIRDNAVSLVHEALAASETCLQRRSCSAVIVGSEHKRCSLMLLERCTLMHTAGACTRGTAAAQMQQYHHSKQHTQAQSHGRFRFLKFNVTLLKRDQPRAETVIGTAINTHRPGNSAVP